MEKIDYNAMPQENLKLLSATTDMTVTNEISEEFELPDYVSEVRKVLSVKSDALPEGRFLSDKGSATYLEYSGTVTYLIIYVDDEGEICSAPLSSSYELSTQLNSNPETVFVETTVDSTNLRVTAPRRLTLKSRLKSRILSFDNALIEEKITPKSIADEMFLQRASKKIKTMEISQVKMQDLKISDKLDSNGEKIEKPIWCDAYLTVSECKAKSGGVDVKGEVTVKCVCQCENGYTTLKKQLPVNEFIELDNSREGDYASVGARCVSLSISNEVSDKSSQLFFDLSCEIEGVVSRNKEKSVTCDCYSTKHETDVTYRGLDTYSVNKSHNTSFTVNEEVKRKNNDVKEIIEILVKPSCEKTEIKGKKAIMHGKAEVNVIGLGEKKDNALREFFCDTYELPIKYETEIDDLVGDCITKSSLSVGKINGKYDSEKLHLNFEVFLDQTIIGKSKVEIIDTVSINKDTEIENDASCIKVYFPKEGDTLWKIAKKYHTTVNKIAEQNELEASSEAPTKKLII